MSARVEFFFIFNRMIIRACIGYGYESSGVQRGLSPKGYAGAGMLVCGVDLG